VHRQRLLKRLDTAWRAFKESYAGLSEAQLMEPGVSGVWSVRDIIAHVTTWEEEALKHLPSILEDRRPPRFSVTYGGIDAFNAQMTKLKGGLSLSDVFRQLDDVHQRVIDVIARAPESHLISEARFRRGCVLIRTPTTPSTPRRYDDGKSGKQLERMPHVWAR